MEVLQCGLLCGGGGAAGQGRSSAALAAATPSPLPSRAGLTRIFPGGWAFALAANSAGELYCWGLQQPTMLGQQGGWFTERLRGWSRVCKWGTRAQRPGIVFRA